MHKRTKVAIQGYPGSFHDTVAKQYWPDESIEIVPTDTFELLALCLQNGEVDVAVMAIENSIAGTILQNYRILRENKFWVVGERFLQIRHQLLATHGTHIQDVKTVFSHPMAINQCRKYLSQHPTWKLVETDDTAKSAEDISLKNNAKWACIASEEAAKLYGLDILAHNIETHAINYTRFFIVQKYKAMSISQADKASIYVQVPDEKGALLNILRLIDKHDLNMSKLQSFPIMGQFRAYYFHIDIEFDDIVNYQALCQDFDSQGIIYEETGIYERADINPILERQNTMIST